MTLSELSVVPVFKLYGETEHWPTPDLLHCESIPERSQLHNWRIRPHQHTDLVHVLLIRRGRVAWELEGVEHELHGQGVIVVPAMTIHGFQFSADVDGHIITLAKPLAEHLSRRANQTTVLTQPRFYGFSQPQDSDRIATLVDQISHEYRQPAIGRHQLLETLAQALTIELSRTALPNRAVAKQLSPQQRDRGPQYLAQLQTLIEQRYHEQPSVAELAKTLGISSAHLNMLCRKIDGHSALEILHARILLEAKRQLTYTNMTIAQVADNLGFAEPAYFTRFFKRNTKLAPREFRKRQPRQSLQG